MHQLHRGLVYFKLSPLHSDLCAPQKSLKTKIFFSWSQVFQIPDREILSCLFALPTLKNKCSTIALAFTLDIGMKSFTVRMMEHWNGMSSGRSGGPILGDIQGQV